MKRKAVASSKRDLTAELEGLPDGRATDALAFIKSRALKIAAIRGPTAGTVANVVADGWPRRCIG